MKKSLLLSLCLVLSTYSQSFAQRGRVKIDNGTIVTDKNTLLRGVFVALDLNKMVDREEVAAIKDYGLNCIHVYAENPSWESAGANVTDLDSLVSWTAQDSLYLIITIGGGTNCGTFDSTFVSDFWSIYAPRYKDETHVIYEIKNEPFAWSSPYDENTLDMQKWAYDLIREKAPETHIQLMSYASAVNEDSIVDKDLEYLGDAIDWTNASIASHGYGTAPQNMRTFIQKIKNAGCAITFTEPQSVQDILINLATTRVFEDEYVSYTHFISVTRLLNNLASFDTRIKSSELRWTPDFGTYPLSIDSISYINPFDDRLAAFYDDGYQYAMVDNDEEYVLSSLLNDSYIGFYNLDFDACPDSVSVRYTTPYPKGSIKIILDSIDGTVVGEFAIEGTADWDESITSSCEIAPFEGIRKIYFKVEDGQSWRYLTLKSIYFSKGDTNSNINITGEVTNTRIDYSSGSIALSVSGGSEPYSYLWTDGYIGKDRDSLAAGNYSVRVTDSSGASNYETFTIEEFDPCLDFAVSGEIEESDSGEDNGSITLTVSGGTEPYSYLWSDSTTVKDMTNLAAGEYGVQVIDNNGCELSDTFTISIASENNTSFITDETANNDIVVYSYGQTAYVKVSEEWLSSGDRMICVFNMSGRLVYKEVLNNLESELNLPGNGVYIIEVISGSMICTEKLIGR